MSKNYYPKNIFVDYFDNNPNTLIELFEFLEQSEVTCYGVELAPSKLRKLKHELMKRGLTIEELQK